MSKELDELVAEAKRREAADGIPRFITKDNQIMKMDWELDASSEEVEYIESETFTEHMVRLMQAHDDLQQD